MNRISTDCHQRKGWQFLSGSCVIRYEVYPFFNLTTAPPPAAAPQLPPGGDGGSSQGLHQFEVGTRATCLRQLEATLLQEGDAGDHQML